MLHHCYDTSPYPIRDGLRGVHGDYWQALAKPGTWFTGAQRSGGTQCADL
jgi:hypothetical protein